MAAKNSRKLNSFTHYGVNQAGGRESMKISMQIETSGQLRLFVDVPAYVTQAVHLDEPQRQWLVDIEGNRIYGRDPDRVKAAMEALFRRYKELITEQARQAIIIICLETRIPNRHGENASFSFLYHDLVIALNFERYWESGGQLFEYDEDDLSSMRSAYCRNEGKRIPYTPEAWQSLHMIRDGMARGVDRLRDFINRDNLPQLLTNGGAENLLGVDR